MEGRRLSGADAASGLGSKPVDCGDANSVAVQRSVESLSCSLGVGGPQTLWFAPLAVGCTG